MPCRTTDLHRELEAKISEFHGTEDTMLYPSCSDANMGLFQAILTDQDAVISDKLNHGSSIDGMRLCKAQRHRQAITLVFVFDREVQPYTGRATFKGCLCSVATMLSSPL